MIEVSKEAFYAAIGGPENIHPSSERDRTVWRDLRTHVVVGKCSQGFVPRRCELDRYYLTPEFAARKGIKDRI